MRTGWPVFENVVVGATRSPGGTRAVCRAIEVARASGGTLHIVRAVGRKGSRQTDLPGELRRGGNGSDPADALLTELRQMASRESVRVQTHPIAADPVEAITRVADEWEADLIVVGSKGAHGARHLTNVPKAVMDRATCAVLVV